MSKGQADDDLPLLTEVILAGQIPLPDSAYEVVELQERAPTQQSVAPQQWEAVEKAVREAVLRGLHGRIDIALEQRIRANLNSMIERLLLGLASEVKAGLHETIRDTVHQAVAQEIARLRTPPR